MRHGLMTLALVALLPVATFAQGNRPCAADVEKFCKGMKPGTPDAMACLKQHEGELSDACKSRVAGRPGGRGRGMGPIRAMLTQCKEDLQKHCKGVQAGGGRFKACLTEHEKDLTPACKEALAGAKNAGPPKGKAAKDEKTDAPKDSKKEDGKAAAPSVTPAAADKK